MEPETVNSNDTQTMSEALEALRESEGLLPALIENLPGGAVFVVDRDLRYLLAQGKALSAAGFKPEDFVGRTIFEALPPELATEYETLYRQGLAGEPFEHEHSAHDRSFISRGTPLWSPDGEVYAVLAVSYDITDRKRTEAIIAADLRDTQLLQDLSARLVAEVDIQVLYDEIVAAAIALMQADAGSLQVLDEATQELVLIAIQGSTPMMAEHFRRVNASSNTPCSIALATGQRTFTDFDVPEREDPDGSLRLHLQAGFLSAQSTPLITRSGKPIGMFSMHWRKHHRPSDRELRFLDLLARQAADMIEQRQAEQSLRESEAKYRSLFNSIDEGFCTIEVLFDEQGRAVDYRFLETNPAFVQQTGIENGVGKTVREFAPEHEEFWLETYGRIAKTGEPMRFEHEAAAISKLYDVYAFRVGAPDENRVAVLFNDIFPRKQAEAALRESEVRFRAVANLVPDLLWDSEPDGSTNWYNQRWLEYTGQTFEQAIGRGWVDAIHPGDHEASARRYREAVETGQPLHQEHRIRRYDGEYRWFVVNALPLKNESGQVVKIYGTATDIHDQRMATEALRHAAEMDAFRVKLSDALRSLTDPVEIQAVTARLLGEHLKVNQVHYGETIGDYVVIQQGYGNGLPPMVGSFRFIDFGERIIADYRAGRTTMSRDVLNDSNITEAERQVIIGAGFQAYIAVPLTKAEGWVATLAVHSIAPRDWTTHEVELLQETAERTWAAVERARAEASLRVSEQKYRSLFNSIDEGFCIIERVAGELIDFRYLEANPAFAVQTGISNVVGKTIRKAFPDAPEAGYEIFENVLNTGEPIRFEIDVSSLERILEIYAFRIDNEPRLAVIFKDITERKRTEAALRHAAEMDAFRVKLSDALRSHSEPAAIQYQAARVLGEHLGTNRAYYVEIEEARSEFIVARDWHQPGAPSHARRYPLEEWPLPWLVDGQPWVVRDVDTDPAMPDDQRESYRGNDIGALIVVPLVKNGRLVATLATNQHTPRDWTADEVALVQETAERTWAGVERAYTETALYESQQRLSTIFAQAAVGLSEISLSGRFLQVNDALCRLLKRSRPNLLAASISDVTHPDDRISSLQALNQVIETGESVSLDKQYLRSDGTTIWANSILTRLDDDQGYPRSILAVTVDLSDRKLAETERLQRIQEQAARAEERQRAETLAELDRAKTLFFSNISHEFRTPLTLLLAPLQDALGDLEEKSALADRTLDPIHRERLELARRNSLRLLKLVNMLLDFSRIEAGRIEAVYEPTDLAQFTTDLASVFRSAIERAGLQLMVDCPPLPEPVYVDREMWEKIVLNLLSNAFKFTFAGEITVSLSAESSTNLQASTSNTHPLTSEPQCPSSELETSTSAAQTPTFNPETSTSLPETSGSELETSTLKLEPSSSQTQTSPSSTHIILQIRDTGTGIAPEHLPHLFERFYQVRGVQARTHEGSGIGLALVHELVKLQGGAVAVSSTVGEGTCFTITLPFGTAHLPPERIQSTRTLTSTALGTVPYVEEAERWLPKDSDPPQPLLGREENSVKVPLVTGDLGGSLEVQADAISSARVLIVDDNADMREYLTRILSEYVQVEAVANGDLALSAIQAQLPDLVLSDVMMPGLDGFGLLQTLRSDPRTREVPVILLSARAGEEAIAQGLNMGADDYLIKPFSAQELISRVNAHLQISSLRGEALHEARTTIRRKDELLSVVSHELNTPLVSILGWTRLLRSNPSNSAMLSKALGTIERSTMIQAKLVQDLLDVSRITAGKLRLNLQPTEVEAVIEAAIATVTQLAAEAGIHLIWTETATAVVMGDRERLQQVVCNLLTNAIKFTPEGGRVEVRLSLVTGHWSFAENEQPRTNNKGQMTNDNYTEIRVTDTGIGIAPDFLPHVFEQFRQAEGTNSAKGLGLGLAIAQHLVELHNGTIQAQSAGTGQGATFIVRLPLLKPNY